MRPAVKRPGGMVSGPGVRLLAVLTLLPCGCGDDRPTEPPPANAMSLSVLAPAAGSTVVLPPEYTYIVPGGLVVPIGSGHLSLRVDMTTAAALSYAQLNVYLLTGGTTTEYCGQNSPDSPTWVSLPVGWTTSVTITGFRVYQVPCEVTGFRAMLHTRTGGSLTPPTPAETVVEAVATRSFSLTR